MFIFIGIIIFMPLILVAQYLGLEGDNITIFVITGCIISTVLFLVAMELGFLDRCKHGVPNGKVKNKCPICEKEELLHIAQENEKKRLSDNLWRSNEHMRKETRRLKDVLSKDLDYLYGLDPLVFETVVMDMYRNLGYQVTQTPYSNDHGKDGIAYKDGQKYLIECKRYEKTKKIGRPQLQKFFAAIIEEKAVKGFFVTTASYADTAYEYAKKSKIDLIDGNQLISLMEKAYPESSDKLVYTVMCANCLDLVEFDANEKNYEKKCKNGHSVHQNINKSVLNILN